MTTKEWFIDILEKSELKWQFINEYGNNNTLSECFANSCFDEGWYFNENTITFRQNNLPYYKESTSKWYITDKDINYFIKIVLLSHGWIKEFEGKDEGDGLVIYKKQDETQNI